MTIGGGEQAARSPSRQLAMIARLHQLVQSHSQFIIATHSPILMAYPHAWIYQVTTHGLERIEYQQTEHYVVAKRFLNDPHRQLEVLLSDCSTLRLTRLLARYRAWLTRGTAVRRKASRCIRASLSRRCARAGI